MGRQGGGDTFCLIISLILEQSAYSKRVSWPLRCQETHSREIYFLNNDILCIGAIILYLIVIAFAIISHFQTHFSISEKISMMTPYFLWLK